MTRRASLPGADELFRSTADQGTADLFRSARELSTDEALRRSSAPESATPAVETDQEDETGREDEPGREDEIVRREQPARPAARGSRPKHGEKVTFYCTDQELTRLERARLDLRAEHHVACDRGRLVRAALAEVLEDFEIRGGASALVRRLKTSSEARSH